jgi:hypothetical protein
MREGTTVQLGEGDVLRVPVMTDRQARSVRVHSLVIDAVRQTADGRMYCFRDHTGPAICIREARLRWLQHRFEQALQGV